MAGSRVQGGGAGEKHQLSGYILNTRFTMDQIWGMEKIKGGIIKILGLKSGNVRMRLNSFHGRAHSLLRALRWRVTSCQGVSAVGAAGQDAMEESGPHRGGVMS